MAEKQQNIAGTIFHLGDENANQKCKMLRCCEIDNIHAVLSTIEIHWCSIRRSVCSAERLDHLYDTMTNFVKM